METKQTKQDYGTWSSIIDASMVGGKTPQINEPKIAGGQLYFLLSLPEQKNRNTIMRYDGESSQSLLPRPINVKSKVHEYGGGAYTIGDQTLFFVLADDQRIYRLPTGLEPASSQAQPEALTEDTDGKLRFADLEWDAKRQRLIAVCEDHRVDNQEASTYLVSIDCRKETPGKLRKIVWGSDFYSNPRLSPEGDYLCWISWRHPDMPWDKSDLHLAQLDDAGALISQIKIGQDSESLCQPRWSPKGELFVVSDRSQWWNIYHCEGFLNARSKLQAPSLQNIYPCEAEFATPPWTFNMSNYQFLNSDEILASFTRNGHWQLCKLSRNQTEWQCELNPLPFSQNEKPCLTYGIDASQNNAVFIQANAFESPSIHFYQNRKSLLSFSDLALETSWVSEAQSVTFLSSRNEQVHSFYYAPKNPLFSDDELSLPPTIVICHGGPTGASDCSLNMKIQYWTSRGFAVMDVNYRGSTGFGRTYRERLYGQWGVLDVDDLFAAASFLIESKLADPDRLIIKGSSAGGYSVLAALANSTLFSAGVSLYGIADLEILANDTHKFEARYLDKLIGPYPEEKALYRARSPLYNVDQFSCPLLVFQGLEDKVVPPNQAEMIVDAVRQKGLPVAYRTFADEGHGFRNIDNISTMLNDELYFYCRIFSLPLPEDCTSNLTIHNLDN